MNRGEADVLLHQAFPYGALVYPGRHNEFFSLTSEVTDTGDDTVHVRFVRQPGDTIGIVSGDELRTAATSGALPLNGSVVRRPQLEDLINLYGTPVPDFVFDAFLGPQVARESGWIARMRLHQTWWRTFVLRKPFGKGPTPNSPRAYGNMLDDDGDSAGSNFLSPEAFAAYKVRIAQGADGINSFRTRRHLLSSQAMAFNLFGHLSHHLPIASSLFSRLLDEPHLSVDSLEIERLSDAIGDRTAFDAFARYSYPSGTGCVAIETKLTEKFSQQDYNWNYYLGLPAFTPDVWTTDDASRLGDRRWSQLWRNHLLAVAEADRYGYDRITQLVVHHPADESCVRAVDGYRALLVDPDQVRAVDLAEWHRLLADLALDNDNDRWLRAFRLRYLELDESEPLARRSAL